MKSSSQRQSGGRGSDREDGYAARQRTRNADYRREYEAWVATLPPEERSRLADMGLEEPQMPDTGASGHRDAAELAACAMQPEEITSEEEECASGTTSAPPNNDRVLDLLRVILGELLSRDNVKLSVECMALVTGLSYNGDSMTAIARRHGVTRAAVSKRCVEYTRALRLAPCRAMRSLKARKSYRQSRINQLDKQP